GRVPGRGRGARSVRRRRHDRPCVGTAGAQRRADRTQPRIRADGGGPDQRRVRPGEGSVNPYLITGPAIISFSGGRTSRYMLKHIIDAHGGTLPDDVVVCFANTGKEMPETLDFVLRTEQEYGCPIVW